MTADQWRVRWTVGGLEHRTAWSPEFGTVENLYEQYRRDEHFENVTIERKTHVQS